MALESGVPLVPIVAVGAHDGWYVWRRGTRIAEFLRLKKYFRIDVFPLGCALPFGFFVGALWPVLPLPRKIILEILPPISQVEAQCFNEKQLADFVVCVMQEKMNELVKELPRSAGA